MEAIKYLGISLCLVANSGYVLMTTPLSKTILIVSSVFVLVLSMFEKGVKIKRQKLLLITVVALTLSVMYSVPSLVNYNSANATYLLRQIILIFLASNIILISDLKLLSHYYLYLVTSIYLASLIFYAATIIFGLDLPFFEIENYNGVKYKYYIVHATFDNFLRIRNASIYWEPGLLASAIFMAFSINLLTRHTINFWIFLTVFIVLCTTLSAAGFVLGVIIVIVYFYEYRINQKSFVELLSIVFIVMAAIPIVSNSDLFLNFDFNRIFIKITNPIEVDVSRVLGPKILLNEFATSPWLGYGIGGSVENYTNKFQELALTSSHALILAGLGVIGVFVVIMPILAIFTIRKIKLITKLCLVVAYLIICNKEIVVHFLTFKVLLILSFSVVINYLSIKNATKAIS